MLYGILDIYEVTGKSSDKLLKDALYEDWDIFNGNPDQIQFITTTLCSEIYTDSEEFFNKTVHIPHFSDNDFLNKFGVIRGKSWLEFSESIKHLNRFHSNLFNADSFTSFLSYTIKPYNKGYKMFRARISDKSGFGVKEMGTPPKDKRSSGRINPEGV